MKYIDGEKYSDPLSRPDAREVLFMSQEARKEAHKTEFTEAKAEAEGSVFFVRAIKAMTIFDCRAHYKSLLCNPDNMAATHNSASYRLYNPEGAAVTDGYADDGEYGMGRSVLV